VGLNTIDEIANQVGGEQADWIRRTNAEHTAKERQDFRDRAAIAAMEGILSHSLGEASNFDDAIMALAYDSGSETAATLARASYACAEAMLRERDRIIAAEAELAAERRRAFEELEARRNAPPDP
jgi:hypothetical protein